MMTRENGRRAAGAWAMAGLLGVSGCFSAPGPDFNSPEPAARNAAIVNAARARDEKAVPDLIRMLDSDDPATRVLAIRALERITGQTRGYDASDPEDRRRKAIDDWTSWYDQRHGGDVVKDGSGPAGAAAPETHE